MITGEMIDAYMDGVDPAWRGLGDKANEQFRGWVRNGLTAVYPLMVAAEREACAQIADRDDGMAPGGNYSYGPNVAIRIAAAIRSRNTSSEARAGLGCASEGGPVSSSDNPNT